MLHTATGHVYAAWLPPKVAEHYIEREAGDAAVVTGRNLARPSADAWLAQLDSVRSHGMARAVGSPLPGIDALSAPVFDHTGGLVLALTALGPSGLFDADWDGAIAQPLAECAADISRKLGYRG